MLIDHTYRSVRAHFARFAVARTGPRADIAMRASVKICRALLKIRSSKKLCSNLACIVVLGRQPFVLGFILRKFLEFGFSMKGFDGRLRLQKFICLLQAHGICLGYDYWCLLGPYCSSLATGRFILGDIYTDTVRESGTTERRSPTDSYRNGSGALSSSLAGMKPKRSFWRPLHHCTTNLQSIPARVLTRPFVWWQTRCHTPPRHTCVAYLACWRRKSWYGGDRGAAKGYAGELAWCVE